MNISSKTILVTGGAGYIGSVLVGQLLERGAKVGVLDRLDFGDMGLRPYLGQERFRFVRGDIGRPEDIAQAIEGADAIVHLAAIVGDPACAKYPDEAIRTNRVGAQLLCETAIENGVHRFVFASTCSNYGKMDIADGWVDESSPLRPVSLYAELKVEFERYLLNLKRDGFAPVCLRFATAHGLSHRPRFDLTVNEFTRDLALGRNLEIYGEQFWRPYCHTEDLARAIVHAIEEDESKVAYQAFNVGDTDENYQKKRLVELILEKLPKMRDRVKFVPKDEDPRDYRVKFGKIKSAFGFEATRRVPDSINDIIEAIGNGVIDDPMDRRYSNL